MDTQKLEKSKRKLKIFILQQFKEAGQQKLVVIRIKLGIV